MQAIQQNGKGRREVTPETPKDAQMESSTNLAALTNHNVRGIYEDLLAKLEESVVTDRARFVDDYIATLVKRDEMTTLWTDPGFYRQLKRAVVNELLPIYDQFSVLRTKAEARLEKGTWSRYCLWTVAICLGIEVIASEGRVMRPQLLIPTVIMDALLGCAIWYLANFRALAELRHINRRMLNTIGELVDKQQVSAQYEVFRTYTGGDLLKAELDELLSSYSTPGEFWRDYYRVRKADPTTEEELTQLGAGRFGNFLQLHVGGTYSEEGRQQRFDALFLLAHKAFILADRQNYILENLNPDQNRHSKETT